MQGDCSLAEGGRQENLNHRTAIVSIETTIIVPVLIRPKKGDRPGRTAHCNTISNSHHKCAVCRGSTQASMTDIFRATSIFLSSAHQSAYDVVFP